MALIKRRPKHSKNLLERKKFLRENTKIDKNSENLASPWKIISMLIFLVIVIILLFKHESENPKIDKNKIIVDPEKPPPPSHSRVFVFKHAAISSDSQSCSDIARNLMRVKNHTVFDLTINALICNSLTNIQSMGLFGGFLLTAYIPSESKSIIIDAQMTSPKHFPSQINDYSSVKRGSLSIAVSGFLKATWEMHYKYGSLPWNELIQPVIDLCRNGIILTKHLRDSIEFNEDILSDSYMRRVFVDDKSGKVRKIGSKIILDKHCDFLDIISRHNNSNDLFSGEIGEILASDLKNANSIITLDELKAYKVKTYDAKVINITEKYSILVPNTSAILIPSILKILSKFNFNSTWFDSENNSKNSILLHHRVIETFKHVFAMRSQLGDDDYVNVGNITDYLLSSDFTEEIVRLINDSRVKENVGDYGIVDIAPESHGTSHISIVDANGDSVSVTSSINFYFGSALTGVKSGLIFNNGMDDFSYENRSVNYFGLKETSTNYPQSGKRALSSASPIILINRDTQMSAMVIGAAGGSKIITAVAVAILRFLTSTNDIKVIIDAPRFHHQLVPNVVEYEYGITNAVIEGLIAKGHDVMRYRYRGTIINALTLNDKHIYAISDYRKDASGVAGY